MRDDYAVALRGEDWRNFNVVMDVVGPAVQQDHGGAVWRPGLGITDIEHTGVDLLQRGERCVGPSLDRRQWSGLVSACAAPITPSSAAVKVSAAALKKRRRSWSMASCISILSTDLRDWKHYWSKNGPPNARGLGLLIDLRSGRKPARTSSEKSCGCSQAAK
jgi:hypothetical protein